MISAASMSDHATSQLPRSAATEGVCATLITAVDANGGTQQSPSRTCESRVMTNMGHHGSDSSASSVGNNSAEGGDLLPAIRLGRTLREAVSDSNGTGVMTKVNNSTVHGCNGRADNGRGDLLSAIRRGSTLKKVPQGESRGQLGATGLSEPSAAGGLMDALASQLEARRLSISQSNSGDASAGVAAANGAARNSSESPSGSDSGWSSE